LTDPAIPSPARPGLGLPAGPPSTYVPFRNGIFSPSPLRGPRRAASAIRLRFPRRRLPDYPDTTKDFVKAMEKAVQAGTKAAFGGPKARIVAPLLGLDKPDIIRLGLSLGADYSYSVSCYAGAERPCGRCSSCRFRAKAWKTVGREDPILARLRKEGKP
jgi:7-cyano-7-deazaguanine synthase